VSQLVNREQISISVPDVQSSFRIAGVMARNGCAHARWIGLMKWSAAVRERSGRYTNLAALAKLDLDPVVISRVEVSAEL